MTRLAILAFVLTVALVTAATIIAAGRPPRLRRRKRVHLHRPQRRRPLPPPPPSPDDDAQFIARLAQRRRPPA